MWQDHDPDPGGTDETVPNPQELSELKDQNEQQMVLIAQLKEMLRKDQSTVSQDKVEEYVNTLNRARAKRSRLKRSDSTSSTTSTSSANIDANKKERVNLLRQQLEENKARLAERGKSQKGLEEMVTQFQAQLKETPSTSSTPLNLSLADKNQDYNENTSQKELFNILIVKERRITDLTAQSQKQEGIILDLQENLREKDSVIDARTKAITLMTDSLSKKGKNTLDQLDDTKEQMRKMQENFVSLEAEMKARQLTLLNELKLKNFEISELQEINTKLDRDEPAETDLKKQVGELQLHNEKLRETSNDFELQLVAIKRENEENIAKVHKQQLELDDYVLKVQELEDKLVKVTDSRASKDSADLLLKIQKLEEQLESVQSDKSEVQKQLDDALIDLKLLKASNLSASPSKSSKQENEEMIKLKKKLDDSNKSMIKMRAVQKGKIKELNRKLDQFRKMNDSNVLISQLQNEIGKLNEKIAELEDDKGHLQLKMVDSTTTTSMEEEIKQLKDKVNETEQELDEKQKQIDVLKADLQRKSEEEIKVTHQVTTEMSSICYEEQIEAEKKKLLEQIEAANNDKEQLVLELDELKRDKADLNNKLESYIQENMELIDKLEKLSAEKVSSVESIEIVEGLTQQEKLELAAYQKHLNPEDKLQDEPPVELNESVLQLGEETAELMQKIDMFTQERKEVMQKMEALKEENNSLTVKLEQVENNRDILEETYEQLQNEKEALEQKLATPDLTELQAKCERLIQENDELKRTLKDLDCVVQEKYNLEDRFRDVVENNTSLDSKLNSNLDEINEYQLTIEENKQDLISSADKINKLHRQLEERENDIQELHINISDLNSVISELQARQANIDSMEEELHKLKSCLTDQLAQTEDYEAEIAQNGETINQLNNELLSMNRRILELENELEVKDLELCKLHKELTTKDDAIKQLQSDLEDKDQLFRTVSEDIKSKYLELQEKLANNDGTLQQQITDVTGKNKEQLEKMKKLAANLKKKTQDHQKLEQQYQTDKQMWESHKDLQVKLQSELAAAEAQLAHKQQEYSQVQRELMDLKEQLVVLQQDNANQENYISDMEKQEKMRQVNDDQQYGIQYMQKQEKIQEVSLQQEMSASLHEDFDGSFNKPTDDKVRELELLLETTENDLSTYKEKVNRLQQEVQTVQDINQRLQSTNAELLDKLNLTSNSFKEKAMLEDQLELRLAEVTASDEALAKKLQEVQEERDELRTKFKDNETLIKKLKIKLKKTQDKVTELKGLEAHILDVEAVNQKLKSQVATLEDHQRNIQSENELMQRKNMSDYEKIEADYETQLAELINARNDIATENEKLLEKVKDLEEREAELNDLRINMEREIKTSKDQKEAELQKMREDFENNLRQLQVMQEEQAKVIANNMYLEGQLEDMMKKLTSMQEEREKLVMKIDSLEFANECLEASCQSSEKAVAQVEPQDVTHQGGKSLNLNLFDVSNEDTIDVLRKELQEAHYEISKLKENDDRESLKQEIENLRKQQNETTEALSQVGQHQSQPLFTAFADSTQPPPNPISFFNAFDGNSQSESGNIDLQEDNRKLEVAQKEIQNLKKTVADLEELVSQHQSSADLEHQLQLAQHEVEDLRRQLTESVQASTLQPAPNPISFFDVFEGNSQTESGNIDLQEANRKLEVSHAEKTEALHQLELAQQEIENLRKQLNKLRSQPSADLGKQLQLAKHEVEDLRVQAPTLQPDPTSFFDVFGGTSQTELQEANRKLEAAQTEIAKLKKIVVDLEDAPHRLEEELQNLRRQLADAVKAPLQPAPNPISFFDVFDGTIHTELQAQNHNFQAAIVEPEIEQSKAALSSVSHVIDDGREALLKKIKALEFLLYNVDKEKEIALDQCTEMVNELTNIIYNGPQATNLELDSQILSQEAIDGMSNLQQLEFTPVNPIQGEQSLPVTEPVLQSKNTYQCFEEALDSQIMSREDIARAADPTELQKLEFQPVVTSPVEPVAQARQAYLCYKDGEENDDGWGLSPDEAKLEEQHISTVETTQQLKETIRVLQVERQNHLDEISQLQVKCGKLLKKCKELKAKASSKSDGFFDLNETIQEELKAQVQQLEKKLKELKAELEKDKAEKDSLLKRVDVLTSANERMMEMKEIQDSEVDRWRRKHEEVRDKLNKFEWEGGFGESAHNQTTSATTSDKQELDKIVEELRLDNQELQALLDEQVALRLESEKNKSTGSSAELAELRTINENLHKDLAALHNKLDNHEVTTLKEQVTGYQQTCEEKDFIINDLQSNLAQLLLRKSELDHTVSQLQVEISQLKSGLDQNSLERDEVIRLLSQEKADLERGLEEVNKKLTGVDELYQLTLQDLQEKTTEVLQCQSLTADLQQLIEEQSEKTQSLVQELELRTQELEETKRRVVELQSREIEVKQLKLDQVNRDAELQKLHAECQHKEQDFQEKMNSVVNDLNESWQTQVDQRGADIAESWKMHLEMVEKDFGTIQDKLKADVVELEEKCNVLVNENNELRKNVNQDFQSEVDKMSALQQQISHLQQTINTLNQEISVKDKQIEEIQNNLANYLSLEAELEKLRADNQEKDTKLASINIIIETTQKQFDEKREVVEEIVSILDRNAVVPISYEKQDILEEFHRQLSMVGNNDKEIDKLNANIKELTENLHRITGEKNREITGLNQVIEDLERDLSVVHEKESEVYRLNIEIDRIRQEKSKLEQQHSQCQCLIEEANGKVQEYYNATLAWQQSLEDKNREVLELNQQLLQAQMKSDNNKEVDTLNKALDNMKNNIVELQAQLVQKTDEIQQLSLYKESKDYYEQECNRLKNLLEDREAELESSKLRTNQLSELQIHYDEVISNKDIDISALKCQIQELLNANQSYVDRINQETVQKQELEQNLSEQNRLVDDDTKQLEELKSIIEEQVVKIDELQKELFDKSNQYDSLIAEMDVGRQPVTRQPAAAQPTTEEPTDLVSRAELDITLYMLHQRDVRCEELTVELTQLLEERDTLQLRLSNAIREKEELKRLDEPSQSTSKEAEVIVATGNEQTHDAEHLATKLSELRTVGYKRDKTFVDEQDARRLQQLSIMQQHINEASKLPPEAAAKLVDASYTLSRDVQSPSKVLLNWLWGKNPPKADS